MKATIGTDINEAARWLKAGEIVAIPTETVYGLAANAFDPDAALKIFSVKERPAFDPLIVHIGRTEELATVTSWSPPRTEELIEAFWPGPLTLIMPKKEKVPDIVTSGLDTVAVRMPAHPMALELLRQIPFPLAAPSANPFGYVSPTSAGHVADQLGEKIPYILDGGPCSVGVESTILGWEGTHQNGHWCIYRQGGTSQESLEEILGDLRVATRSANPIAPGMMASHYAPHKPLYVGDLNALIRRFAGSRIGVIAFRDEYPTFCCEVLSAHGDLTQAARNLFGALRDLDASDCDVILSEEFPDEGLGRAINDRLRRASAARI